MEEGVMTSIQLESEAGTFSSNWKALQKDLEVETAKKREALAAKKTEDGSTGPSRKRKRKKPKVEQRSEWKKRREEIEESEKDPPEKNEKTAELTKALGLDCEYVGGGSDGATNILARVSLVNSKGECVYDKYVKPRERVTDYRTDVSGIRAGNLVNGETFQKVQLEVHKLLADKIVVGHALQNDFKVLNLSHTRKMTRDTAKYAPLRKMANITKTPSLKLLAKHVLGIEIQQGEHDSVTDARVAMRMYVVHKKAWEADIRRFNSKK